MYVITEGLGKKYRWLAVFFCVAGVVGCLPMFQINQLVQAIRELIFLEQGWIREDQATEFNLIAGLVLAATIATVILGGISRISKVVSRLVPLMSLLYVGAAFYILLLNWSEVPH